MDEDPYQSPRTAGDSPARQPGALKSRLIGCLAVVGIVGLLIALFLPAVRSGREPMRRVLCANNLKQIALALQNYESVHQSLPPAYTVDVEGRPLHSWRTLILPYLEQQPLYETIDLSKAWDDPVNRGARETKLLVYQCPSADCPPGHTAYLAVLAANGCFRATGPRRLSEITDNPDSTLMVVDADSGHAVPWMSPRDTDEQWLLNLGTVARLPHPGGAQVVCVGGNVLFLSAGLQAATLRALVSIDGNDDNVAQEAN